MVELNEKLRSETESGSKSKKSITDLQQVRWSATRGWHNDGFSHIYRFV